MQISVSLPVCVGHHVNGHTIYRNIYVCSVIEIEPSQKELLGLTATRMLTNEQARNQSQYLLRICEVAHLYVYFANVIQLIFAISENCDRT